MPALPDTREAVAGRDDPAVGGRALAALAEVFEDSRIVGGNRGEVIEGFVYACNDTGGGDVVTQDSAIHDLRKKSPLWDQLTQEMRDVLLSVRHQGFFIASASAERNDYGFGRLRSNHAAKQGRPEERRSRAGACRGSQEIAAAERDGVRYLPRAAVMD